MGSRSGHISAFESPICGIHLGKVRKPLQTQTIFSQDIVGIIAVVIAKENHVFLS